MKLRNKRTGEIVEIKIYKTDKWGYRDNFSSVEGEDSLTKLNEEWEDYEEPKEFWFIDDEGGVNCGVVEFEENLNLMQQIGNYFKTKEEAEKAVKCLRAWKRLRDKGFRFREFDCPDRVVHFEVPASFFPGGGRIHKDTEDDLDLLFCEGSEE